MAIPRRLLSLLRFAASVCVVAVFLFPIFWLGLTSIKPLSAIYNKDEVIFFDFKPLLDNYQTTFVGSGGSSAESRQTLFDTGVVACSSTIITLCLGILAGFALSMYPSEKARLYTRWILAQRSLPVIAVVIPLILIFNSSGLINSRIGLVLAYSAMNTPLAVLMMKSFFDDVPRSVGEAAMIDGASRWQTFARIYVPMIRGGIAATAVLCFIYAWTEFMMAVFLTHSVRMASVQLVIYSNVDIAVTAALSTVTIMPTLLFILFAQKHLVRGLTLGLEKG